MCTIPFLPEVILFQVCVMGLILNDDCPHYGVITDDYCDDPVLSAGVATEGFWAMSLECWLLKTRGIPCWFPCSKHRIS